MTDTKKKCFVVMGFGKKTDYETGKVVDLNETYSEIIKPAVEAAGFNCFRADEISGCGKIDIPMYNMLLNADLVIADISTGNVNAVYELGVRHALKRNRTIIMKESDCKLSFDLNHISTFNYRHLGEEIGAKEARRAKTELSELITNIFNVDEVDSPLYSFLPNLKMPILTKEEIEEIIEDANDIENNLLTYIKQGEHYFKLSEFTKAVDNFKSAHELRPNESYILQKLVLATYKSKEPSELESLLTARTLLSKLSPEISNDPETTGLAGAIQKRLWLLTKDPVQLDKAIEYYFRGFIIKKDYYNGENLAACFDLKCGVESNSEQKTFYTIAAKKTRTTLYDLLSKLINSSDFDDRHDKKWIYATMANICFKLEYKEKATDYENLFYSMTPTQEEVETYTQGKTT